MKELRKTYIQVTEEEDELIDRFYDFCENCASWLEDEDVGGYFSEIKEILDTIISHYSDGINDCAAEVVNDFNPLTYEKMSDDTYSEDIVID